MSPLPCQHASSGDLLPPVQYEVVILPSPSSGVFLLCSSVTVDILSSYCVTPQTLKMGKASLSGLRGRQMTSE